MRKFKHEISGEIVTFKEIKLNPNFIQCVIDNYKDDELFADWLISRDYTPFEIWKMNTYEKLKVRKQFLVDCEIWAIIDLNYEEIFID